jgi:hypothetical protein
LQLESRSGISFTTVHVSSTRRRRRRLWVSAVVLVVVALAAVVVFTGKPMVSGGGPEGPTQAKAIDELLDSSTTGRGYLLTAIDDINACDVTGSTLIYVRDAAAARLNLLNQTGDTVVTDLPDGDRIKVDLTAAMRASFAADQAYLTWVLAAHGACPARSGSAYAPVVAANEAADRAKRRFLADWNPVARKYGLAQRNQTVI